MMTSIRVLLKVKMRESFDLGTFTTEGTAASGWVLMDFGKRILHCLVSLSLLYGLFLKFVASSRSGSIFVHIMTPQMRNFYKIEKKWKDAEVRGDNNTGKFILIHGSVFRKWIFLT